MSERPLAPETLPRCPVCDKRVFCLNDDELIIHVDKCFEKKLRKTVKE